jgi:hypothetical protein
VEAGAATVVVGAEVEVPVVDEADELLPPVLDAKVEKIPMVEGTDPLVATPESTGVADVAQESAK